MTMTVPNASAAAAAADAASSVGVAMATRRRYFMNSGVRACVCVCVCVCGGGLGRPMSHRCRGGSFRPTRVSSIELPPTPDPPAPSPFLPLSGHLLVIRLWAAAVRAIRLSQPVNTDAAAGARHYHPPAVLFLPRDAIRKRRTSHRPLSVSPSVRPSVRHARVLCRSA